MQPSTRVRILEKAREIIADPAHWTQGSYARDMGGHSVNVSDEGACSFCTLGAIRKASLDLAVSAMDDYIARDCLGYDASCFPTEYMSPTTPLSPTDVIHFNDRFANHDDIINLFDCAIEKAKEAAEAE